MDIKLLQQDEQAQKFVREVFGSPERVELVGVLTVFKYSLGGPNSVAAFSLPQDKMFYNSKRNARIVGAGASRATVSVYMSADLYPKRGEIAQDGVTVKDWNKAMRPMLTPKQLIDTNVAFVAVICGYNLQDVDMPTIKAYVTGLTKLALPQGTEERGGHVAYDSLPHNRLITPSNMNSGDAKFVWYGTSGSHNVAELLLTLAVGYKLNLPVLFDNYGSNPDDSLQGQNKMRAFAERLASATGAKFNLKLASTFETSFADVKNYEVSMLARVVVKALKHDVLLLHHPKDGSISTDSFAWLRENGHKTLTALHKEGAKMAGSPIYWAYYGQANHSTRKKFVALLYDGSKGAIHRLAVEYMREPHGLWVCPVGAFAIRPRGTFNQLVMPDPDSLCNSRVLEQLWELALERVPLAPDKVGTKIKVEVGDHGVKVVS